MYGAETFSASFRDTTNTKKYINSYMRSKTYGRMPELVKFLDPEGQMVLVNCLLFKGEVVGLEGKWAFIRASGTALHWLSLLGSWRLQDSAIPPQIRSRAGSRVCSDEAGLADTRAGSHGGVSGSVQS